MTPSLFSANSPIIYRENYQVPSYTIEKTDLIFELEPSATLVTAHLTIRRLNEKNAPLILDGESLELISVALNEEILAENKYVTTPESLRLEEVPEYFVLTIKTKTNPTANTALSGLYVSRGLFCTQCEAHGFRRITYYLDRPDVMAKFTTTIYADEKDYPVLLSNGNLVAHGKENNGRHWAKWEDPFKKPCYLFALVAGNLTCVEDSFVTMSARKIALRFFVEKQDADKCDHAIASLKKAMRWDEEVFGREYDLDIFMVVAVSDFNMGAMENKGLNIFNSQCVLASPQTATDFDYQTIEGVVAHEYFHNWTGNRITCQNWFQLSLKEGLTVYRDQEFSRAMNSPDVFRIQDVQNLRTFQFAEDGGPMAHPVRPDSYIEVNNFYTTTVYEKGAEVVRMIATLMGKEGFKKGMDLYFSRHDGQAVTIEDFVASHEQANEVDLTQFKLWYSQSGTPRVQVSSEYEEKTQRLRVHVKQSCPPTPNQPIKKPFHIPLAVGLVGKENKTLSWQYENKDYSGGDTIVLSCKQPEETFIFDQVAERPILSLLRGFSAPVKLEYKYSDEELVTLFMHDVDGFVRYEAIQRLLLKRIREWLLIKDQLNTQSLDQTLLNAFKHTLKDNQDPALRALLLSVPSEITLAEHFEQIDVEGLHQVRKWLVTELARNLRPLWEEQYHALKIRPAVTQNEEFSIRCLKNLCLGYLAYLADDKAIEMCQQQLKTAANMTDAISALGALCNIQSVERTQALDNFYEKWQQEELVVNKWFSVQARAQIPNALEEVKTLLNHPAFTWKNPNKVRSLIGGFVFGNPSQFHRIDGAGYQFLVEAVEKLNSLNPQIAARLVHGLISWRRYDEVRQQKMRAALEYLKTLPLSKDVGEIVTKSLQE